MIGTLYNPPGQLNIKVLLVCPYDLDHHGGVQNQIKLLKNGLVNKGINTKILGPSSYAVSYTHLTLPTTIEV